jgi:2-octaprenyl-6-methoxyphenol hydroxylase
LTTNAYIDFMMKVDVAVIGAGLNGIVAALALAGKSAKQPLSVVVIDRFDPYKFAQSSHDSRASALTSATQNMFQALGIWSAVAPHAQSMEKILVTDSKLGEARPSLLSFAEVPGRRPAAAMVENQFIYASLLSEIEKSKNIQLLTGQNIQDITYGSGLAQVKFDNETSLKASLIIGADGRNSLSRQKAGLEMSGWEYAQSAITLTVKHELPHGGEAEEHFHPNGVFAILPLSGNRSSIVWTENHGEAIRLRALEDAAFLSEITLRFGSHRGKLDLAGSRHLHPLSLGLASEFTAPRLALIGDAAHVVHPLAGLGLNLGFKDVACLADCVMDALRLGQDIGSAQMLDQYALGRRFDTVSTIYALDGLNRLFSNDIASLKLLRDAGLRLVDKVPNLKALFMKEAAGQTGNLPRLMRGLAA